MFITDDKWLHLGFHGDVHTLCSEGLCGRFVSSCSCATVKTEKSVFASSVFVLVSAMHSFTGCCLSGWMSWCMSRNCGCPSVSPDSSVPILIQFLKREPNADWLWEQFYLTLLMFLSYELYRKALFILFVSVYVALGTLFIKMYK